AYYDENRATLRDATADQFSPDLDSLDAMMSSFSLESPVAQVLYPTGGEGTFDAQGLSFAFDASLATRIELRETAQYVESTEFESMMGSTPSSIDATLFG